MIQLQLMKNTNFLCKSSIEIASSAQSWWTLWTKCSAFKSHLFSARALCCMHFFFPIYNLTSQYTTKSTGSKLRNRWLTWTETLYTRITHENHKAEWNYHAPIYMQSSLKWQTQSNHSHINLTTSNSQHLIRAPSSFAMLDVIQWTGSMKCWQQV